MLRSILRASELCLASLPGLRFVRRWRARGSRCQAQASRCRWRWSASSSWSSRRCFATCNLANFLRPLAPGRRTIRLLGCRSDSCQRGRSFWEPRSEGETNSEFSDGCLLRLPGFLVRVISRALEEGLDACVEFCVGGENRVNWVLR